MTSGMMIGRGNGRDQFGAGNGVGSSRKRYADYRRYNESPDGVERPASGGRPITGGGSGMGIGGGHDGGDHGRCP